MQEKSELLKIDYFEIIEISKSEFINDISGKNLSWLSRKSMEYAYSIFYELYLCGKFPLGIKYLELINKIYLQLWP